MLGVADEMIKEIQAALASSDSSDDFLPLPNMGTYFVSRTKQQAPGYGYMFSENVDGQEVHIYIRV